MDRNIPSQTGNDMSTHDRSDNQSAVRRHGPAKNDPNAISGVEKILTATTGNRIGNSRQQPGRDTGHNHARDIGNETDNEAADGAQGSADNVQSLAAKCFGPGREDDRADHLAEKEPTAVRACGADVAAIDLHSDETEGRQCPFQVKLMLGCFGGRRLGS